MMHPYDETYFFAANETFSDLLDYLYYYQELDYKEIENILCKSKYVKYLLTGNPYYTVGKSSIEIIKLIEEEFHLADVKKDYVDTLQKSPLYWAGYALSYYCYERYKNFLYIFSAVKLEQIIFMYKIYHEMDISRFIENIDDLINKQHKETHLKLQRMLNNLSQSELAMKSGVSLRNIQLYEQRVNDIDKAQSKTLFKLAKTLHCSIEDLLENPLN